MTEVFAPRVPWPETFPKVVTHTSVANRDAHGAYVAAKSGDHNAAFDLVADLIKESSIEALKRYVTEKPFLVPVGAIEKSGYNAIPSAMADALSYRLALPLDEGELRQINKVGHTRARTWQRMVTPPLFGGEVKQGGRYILVDDHVGVGGTLANLRGYIENNGGIVLAMTTLTASRDAETINSTPEIANMLKLKHGEELERFWNTHFGYGLLCLTRIEGRQISREPSFDSVRRCLFKAADEAYRGGITPVASLSQEKLE